ncbi:uncharacterized protein LOC126827962 [Patella vulgata]|uniref:uncharacterized protein LOC126827962 n=1 Tax=Patella vulgata TaxID=6465 RepID=UPI0024A9E4F4|nr:uncharacterized protein LOC126827962 [Patella vulgata]
MAAVREVKGRNVKLGGDARCCSPGHTAKYGSYSLMDLESGIVLDVQLIQVTEVNDSYAMEKEGLIRGLEALKGKGVQATDLTTDRHCSVRKHMRTMEPDINHWFDVWHVAKGVYKKLILLSKKKGCEQIEEWAQSISNHLYWAAASSDGDGDLVEAKWKSITNHVANLHDGHGELYQRCQHEHLDRSKAHKLLKECLLKKSFMKDIQKLSPAEQTSKLESYHKVVCQFAPKFQHFFYDAMNARLLLAAMHNNENCVRQQATKRDGTAKWKIAYPKAKHGDHTLKPVLDSCSYGYVKDLLREVMELREAFPSYKAAQVLVSRDAPPPTTLKSANRIELNVAITRHHSRFNTT